MRTDDVIDLSRRLLDRAKEVGALQYGDFTLTSGAKSSFYFDGRLLSPDPEGIHIISTVLVDLVCNKLKIQAFGGPAVGAVPVVGSMMLAAHNATTPLKGFFVRSEAKAHGTAKQIEGHLHRSHTVAIYDDTISTGGSLLTAIDAVREIGATITLLACILHRKQAGSERLHNTGIPIFNILKVSDQQELSVDEESISNWFN